MTTARYSVSYESDEEGYWVASVAEIQGCHTQGKTIRETRERLYEALALYDVVVDYATFDETIQNDETDRGRTVQHLAVLADKSLAACKLRGWKTDWQHRGVYLHLEVSEFVEALRGKGESSPEEEAADVLNVLLSAIASHKLDLNAIFRIFDEKLVQIVNGTIGSPA